MSSSGPSGRSAPRAWVLASTGASHVRIWGLSAGERLRRSMARAGCAEVQTLAPGERIEAPRVGDALVAAPGTLLVDPEAGTGVAACVAGERAGELVEWIRAGRGGAPPGVRAAAPGDLVSGYIALLRKHEPAYLYPADAAQAAQVEARTFAAAYKGSTDLVTKWVWPAPARATTRWLARRGVHPNTVTVASWVLAIAAGGLFAAGRFASGLAVAWLMTFLDTVDGKLARVTLRSSRFGHVLDHSLDLIHPPFWWFAWAWGVGTPFAPETWIVLAGYLLGRLEEGIFL